MLGCGAVHTVGVVFPLFVGCLGVYRAVEQAVVYQFVVQLGCFGIVVGKQFFQYLLVGSILLRLLYTYPFRLLIQAFLFTSTLADKLWLYLAVSK